MPASRAERANAAHAAQGPAERNGDDHPSHPSHPPSETRTMRTAGPASHRAMSAVSSTSAPPSGAGAGRIAWAPAWMASTTGIGGTPRPAVPAAASWPWRMTGKLVAALTIGAVRSRGDQLGQRGQRAQPLAAPQHLDGGGGAVTQSRGALVVAAFGQRGHLVYGRGRTRVLSSPSIRAAARATAAAYCVAVTSRAAGQGDTSTSGQAGPVQCRAPQPRGTGPYSGEPGQQSGGLGGVGTGPERADDAVVARRAHHRQPRKRLVR